MKKFLLIGLLSALFGSFETAQATIDVTINPAEGNVVGPICDIEITFPEGYDISFAGGVSRSFPSISGPESASMWYSGYSFSGNVMKFKLGSVGVKVPGDYVLTVPAASYSVAGGTSEELKFHYTIVADEKVKEYTLTPTAGDQSELGSIVVTFPSISSLKLTDESGVKLTGPNGDCAIYAEANSNYLVVVPEDGSTSADGEYHFEVAAGALTLMEGFVNDKIEATYNVTHAKSEIATISPAAGEYHSLKHFEVSFIDQGDITANFSSEARPQLTNSDTGTVVAVASSGSVVSGTILEFDLDEEVTELGSYTLNIPGVCYLIGDAQGQDLSASYSIVKNTDAYYWEASPADQSTVAELKVITISFPNATSISRTSTAKVTVTDSKDATHAATMSVSGTTVTIRISETLENGTYTVSIPSEAFDIVGSDGSNFTSRPITLTYTIDSETSVNAIVTDSDNAKQIYDLNGRRVNAEPANGGLYIINGQKVLIKR